MNFIYYCKTKGKGAQLVEHLRSEGNTVIINPVLSEALFYNPDSIVIFGDRDTSGVANRLRKRGVKIFGAGTNVFDFFRQFDIYPDKYETEVVLHVFMVDGNPLPNPAISIESKRFLTGDLGEHTNGQTCVMWGCKEKEPKLYQKVIKKIRFLIKDNGYTGILKVRCTLGRNGEIRSQIFDTEIDDNSIFALSQILEIELGSLICGMVNYGIDNIPYNEKFGGSVMVSYPPYPYVDNKSGVFWSDNGDFIEDLHSIYDAIRDQEKDLKQYRVDLVSNATHIFGKLIRNKYAFDRQKKRSDIIKLKEQNRKETING